MSEVVTGGASASDEWIEVHDHGSLAADLGGLELVYVTASGGTVTRKASWQQQVLKPGASLLLANASGVFASLADDTWSGGLAAAGGTIVLRVTGGAVVDSLSWGTASSAWVEGRPGLAPPAGSSLERLPDEGDRNGRDTNDNRDDTWVQAQPVPDARHIEPTPTPTEAPTPRPTVTPEPEPTEPPSPGPTATPERTERPSPGPTATPERTERPSPEPTAEPTATPEPTTAPTPDRTAVATAAPTPDPTDRPTPQPTPAPLDIGTVRGMPSGSALTFDGVLTTPLGLTETGRGAFIEDATAGIGLYLSSAAWPAIPSGHLVRVSGTLTSRYGQLTLSLASAADLVDEGLGVAPDPVVLMGQSLESVEGRLVTVRGTVTGSRDALADGYAIDLVGDTASYRVVIATGTAIDPASLPSGRRVVVTGVMGQHASTTAATNGYRIWPRSPADIVDQPVPTTSPSATPGSGPVGTPGATETPSPTTTAGPTPVPTMTAGPTPVPTMTAGPTPVPTMTAGPTPVPTARATPSPTVRATATPRPTSTPISAPVVSIAAARGLPVGSRIAVEGTVTAVPGRVLRAGVTFLQDGTGGLAVALPDGIDISLIQPGVIVQLSGKLANPYANLELRAGSAADLVVLGRGGLPSPVSLTSAGLTEAREGDLARITGIVEGVETGSSGSLAITLRDNGGETRVFAFGALGVSRDRFTTGARVVATGIVGQRESTSGAGDGYRLWPRDSADLVVAAATPTARPGGAATPRPTATARPGTSASPSSTMHIGSAREGQTVTVQGTVTAPAGLLDGEGRRVTIQDGTGAILLRYPDGVSAPAVGTRIRVSGEVGTWYGGLQIAADAAPSALGRTTASPIVLRRAPGATDEWRLVRVTVRISNVSRSGETWRAEASLGAGGGLPIVGMTGSHIPSTALAEGRSATITGIVKRAYPTATDQRFALIPRGPGDIQLGRDPSTAAAAPGGADSGDGPAGGDASASSVPGGAIATPEVGVVDTTLDALTSLAGRHVRVSGALRRVDRSLLTIDDGSASAFVRLLDDDATFQPPLVPGEVLNVTGVVAERDVGGWEVVARSEALVRASSLSLPTLAPSPASVAADIAPSAVPSPAPATAAASEPPVTAGPNDPFRLGFAIVVGAVAALVVMVGGLLMTRSLRRQGAQRSSGGGSAAASPPVPPGRPGEPTQPQPGEPPDRPLDAL